MSIYKPKKSPFYAYSFDIKGVRFHGSTGTASFEEAKAVEAAKREEARKAALFPGDKKKLQMTVNVALDRYFVEVSQHTAGSDDDMHKGSKLLSLGPHKMLSEITDSDIAMMVAKRRGQVAVNRKKPVSNATVNRETELLRRIIRRAKDLWGVDIGDEPKWSKLLLPEADERVRELTGEEEKKLFAALRDDFKPMVEFAIMSGLRLANVIRLTWKEVDLATGKLTVRTKSLKPGGKVHTIPISPAMRVLIANQHGNHPIFVFTYVCEKSRNEKMGTKRVAGHRYPFSRDGWRKAWAAALEDAGIEDCRFHDLRHTAATRIVRATGNIKIAQKLLGHASLVSTARYAHVSQDDVLEAMMKVDHRKITGPKDDDQSKSGGKSGGSAA